MEDNIKNFDRGIERAMNEMNVAPPFGMWNRISSELDALPVAAGAAPASLLPKRAMIAFIAGTMILAGSLTAYWVNSSANKEVSKAPAHSAAPVSKSIAAPASSNQPQTTAVVPTEQKSAPVAYRNNLHNTIAKPVEENTVPVQNNQSLQAANETTTNLNSDVPAPISPVMKSIKEPQTYYFPPIDVNSQEKNATALTSVAKPHDLDNKPYDDDRPRADIKKFKPKKHGGWDGYGHINKRK